MDKSPAYYRARIKTLEAAISYELSLPESRETQMRLAYLRNGHIPDKPEFLKHFDGYTDIYAFTVNGLTNTFYGWIQNEIQFCSNDPLTQLELHTYDTWFQVHKDKVCGKQTGGSGYSFPVKTIGTKQDIIDAIAKTLRNMQQLNPTSELDILELEAEALNIELELLNL